MFVIQPATRRFLTSCCRTVSTPFLYYPRTRPAVSVPRSLVVGPSGVLPTSEWRLFETKIYSRIKAGDDVISQVSFVSSPAYSQSPDPILWQLYIPSSRIFCLKQNIPFYLVFKSTARSLAAFMPYSPNSTIPLTKRAMRLELLRQCTVDVR
jgi:hypothetical protein